MNGFEDFFAEHEDIINSVSQQYGARGHRYGADHDDIRQELSMWIFLHLAKLKHKAEELQESFDGWLSMTLRNLAKDHLSKLSAQAGGRDTGDQYYYSVGELKVLLPSIFDPDARMNPPKFNGEDRSKRDPAHGNNWLTTLADVSSAYNKLDLEDQNLLALFHRDGWRNKDLAATWDLTEAQMSWRHQQACERLLDHLGGPRPKKEQGPADPFKGRKSMSNAAARAMTTASYEDE